MQKRQDRGATNGNLADLSPSVAPRQITAPHFIYPV